MIFFFIVKPADQCNFRKTILFLNDNCFISAALTCSLFSSSTIPIEASTISCRLRLLETRMQVLELFRRAKLNFCLRILYDSSLAVFILQRVLRKVVSAFLKLMGQLLQYQQRQVNRNLLSQHQLLLFSFNFL